MAPREQVLFGAAYYHEYQPSPRLETDLDLMAEAGFTVIRVGESVWTTWEPEDGGFDLDWLQPVLDGAHARGITVILGTPTYAVAAVAGAPLSRRSPARAATGVARALGRPAGDRLHPPGVPVPRRAGHPRRSSGRYADHPAVIGYQVDNEPGIDALPQPRRLPALRRRAAAHVRHGRGAERGVGPGLLVAPAVSTWADLWLPDGNYQPQYDLAWRTFQARLTTEFIAWQAGIVREYARDDQFVTTCIAYERPGVDDANLTRDLDVTAGNPYYAMQDALAVPSRRRPAAGLDDRRGLDAVPQRRPDVASQAGALPRHRDQRGGHRRLGDELPGVRRAVAPGRVGVRGARRRDDRVLALAHEPFRHRDLLDRRSCRTTSSPAGSTRARAGSAPTSGPAGAHVLGLTPDAQVGLLYSARSKWGLASQAPFTPGARRREHARRGGPALVPPDLRRVLPRHLRRRACPPGSSTTTSSSGRRRGDAAGPRRGGGRAARARRARPAGRRRRPARLAARVRRGRRAPRARPADRLRRRRGPGPTDVKPARLAEAAGVRYQEFSNLDGRCPWSAEERRVRALGGAAAARDWVDGLISDGGEVAPRLRHPHFGQFPAVVTADTRPGPDHHGRHPAEPGAGRRPAPLARPGRRTAVAGPARVDDRPLRHQRRGERIHVVHNWAWEPAQVDLPTRCSTCSPRATPSRSRLLGLGPWDVRVLREPTADGPA